MLADLGDDDYFFQDVSATTDERAVDRRRGPDNRPYWTATSEEREETSTTAVRVVRGTRDGRLELGCGKSSWPMRAMNGTAKAELVVAEGGGVKRDM